MKICQRAIFLSMICTIGLQCCACTFYQLWEKTTTLQFGNRLNARQKLPLGLFYSVMGGEYFCRKKCPVTGVTATHSTHLHQKSRGSRTDFHSLFIYFRQSYFGHDLPPCKVFHPQYIITASYISNIRSTRTTTNKLLPV